MQILQHGVWRWAMRGVWTSVLFCNIVDRQTNERAIGDSILAKICWSVCETETCILDSQSNFLHFGLLIASLAQILTDLLQFKFWFMLGPYDIINEAIHESFQKHIHNSMIHMYTKFEDDTFVRSSVITKNVIFLIKEYSVRLWCHPVTSSMTSSPWKYFSHIIWDDLFISDVELKLCLIFWHFQNGHHFEVATNFFTGSDTRNWICYKDSHEHLWHFELLIDALAQILTELLQFQVFTYFEL